MNEAVDRYIRGVMEGTLTVGRLQRLAVERHLYDLEHAHKRGWHFDELKAQQACDFFPMVLTHTKGEWAGKPFVLSDNQAFIVWCLYGWRRKDGTRRFRKAYITCARKWGKSEFAAGLGLKSLCLDDPIEPGAEVYCAATKEDQARIVHDVAKQMARQGPVLRDQCGIFAKSISTKATALQQNGFFKPLGSDSKTSDGLNIHVAVLDEIHEWRERHRGLYEKLTTASGSRRQPMIITITTAGDDHSYIWKEMDDLCVKTLENFADDHPPGDTQFVFIARLDEARPCDCRGDAGCDVCDGKGEIPADDPLDPANWPKANPNYPVTPKPEFMQEQADEAKHSPASLHAFMRYHVNVRVASQQKLISPALWSSAAGELADWSKADAICGAWDLGGRDDLAALALVARFRTGEYDDEGNALNRYELHQQSYINTQNERDITREPWSHWVATGRLIVSGTELLQLKADARKAFGDQYVKQWAYDPHTSRDVAQDLECEGLECVRFTQSCSMYNEPLRTFLKALQRGHIRHDGDPLLAWAAGNLVGRFNATELMMPDKKESPEKVDPIVAVIMAFRLAMLAPSQARGALFVY